MVTLVPIDDSDPSRNALEQAFSEPSDSEYLVLHVIDPQRAVLGSWLDDIDTTMDRAQANAEALLEEAERLANAHDVTIETEIEFGAPHHVILEYAELDEIDKIVLGSHGRTGVSRAFLGSVAEKVVRRSPVPVTIVR